MPRSDNQRHVFGFLREIRASAQGLQSFLLEVQKAAEGKDAAARQAHYQGAAGAGVEARDRAAETATRALAGVRDFFRSDAEAHEWCPDYVVHLETLWHRCRNEWPDPARPPEEVAAAIAAAVDHCDQIIYRCESLTLAPRVNDILVNVPVGQGIRLTGMFDDELPRAPALQQNLLKQIADQSGAISRGYVDEDNGIIWRVADTRAAQQMSVWRLIGAALLCLGLIGLASWAGTSYDWGEGWPFKQERLAERLIAFTLMFAGGVIHVVVDALKASRGRTQPLRSPWNDWVLWLNARESQVMMSVVALFIVYVALVWTMARIDPVTALLAGYSADSLLEIVLDRFDRLAQTQTKRLTDVLRGPAPESTTAAGSANASPAASPTATEAAKKAT